MVLRIVFVAISVPLTVFSLYLMGVASRTLQVSFLGAKIDLI